MESLIKEVNIEIKPSDYISDKEWSKWITSLVWSLNKNGYNIFPIQYNYIINKSPKHYLKLTCSFSYDPLNLTQPTTITENASIAAAFLGVFNFLNVKSLRLGRKNDGFDYYLFKDEQAALEEKYEESIKIEISGILSKRNNSEVKNRIKEKKLQCKKNPIYSNLIGYVAVSDFKDLFCHIDQI